MVLGEENLSSYCGFECARSRRGWALRTSSNSVTRRSHFTPSRPQQLLSAMYKLTRNNCADMTVAERPTLNWYCSAHARGRMGGARDRVYWMASSVTSRWDEENGRRLERKQRRRHSHACGDRKLFWRQINDVTSGHCYNDRHRRNKTNDSNNLSWSCSKHQFQWRTYNIHLYSPWR